jgi:hypothetical protein
LFWLPLSLSCPAANGTFTTPRCLSRNANSSDVFEFDLVVYNLAGHFSISYQVPDTTVTTYEQVLVQQFPAVLKKAAAVTFRADLVDRIAGQVVDGRVVLTFRILDVGNEVNFFNATLADLRRAASLGQLDVPYNGITLAAVPESLAVVSLPVVGTTSGTRSPTASTSTSASSPPSQGATKNGGGRASAVAIVVTLVAALALVLLVVVYSQRRVRRLQQSYERLNGACPALVGVQEAVKGREGQGRTREGGGGNLVEELESPVAIWCRASRG